MPLPGCRGGGWGEEQVSRYFTVGVPQGVALAPAVVGQTQVHNWMILSTVAEVKTSCHVASSGEGRDLPTNHIPLTPHTLCSAMGQWRG